MVPILKLQKGDTINGLKIKQEGRFALNYLKRLADAKYNRWLSRLEIRNGKPNGSTGVMSGTDPLGSFFELLNNYIKRRTDEEIYNLFTNYKPNGYVMDYVKGILLLKSNLIPLWANNFRLAQIKVPATVGYLITRKKNE